MKLNIYKFSISILMLCLGNVLSAQYGFGTNTPNENSAVDIVSTDKGLLIPRVSLTSTATLAPITGVGSDTANIGMLVFNNGEDQITEQGFYYWSGTQWRILTADLVDTDEQELTATLSKTTQINEYILELTNSVSATLDMLPYEEVEDGAIGDVPTLSDRPTGSLFLDTTSNTLYGYDGANWEFLNVQDLSLSETGTVTETEILITNGESLSLQASGSLSFIEGDDGELVLEVPNDKGSIYTVDGILEESRVLNLSDNGSTVSQTLTLANGNADDQLIIDTNMRIKDKVFDKDDEEALRGQLLVGTTNGKLNWAYNMSNITEKTEDYAVSLDNDEIVFVNPASDITITLPTPATEYSGKTLIIKRTDDASSGNKLVLTSAATIDGTNTYNMNIAFQGFTLKAFNSRWYIIEKF